MHSPQLQKAGRTVAGNGVKVSELYPGMVFVNDLDDGRSGTVICTTPHPIFRGFTLVVWKMSDGTMSFDALSLHQELPMRWIGQSIPEMQVAWQEATGLRR